MKTSCNKFVLSNTSVIEAIVFICTFSLNFYVILTKVGQNLKKLHIVKI